MGLGLVGSRKNKWYNATVRVMPTSRCQNIRYIVTVDASAVFVTIILRRILSNVHVARLKRDTVLGAIGEGTIPWLQGHSFL